MTALRTAVKYPFIWLLAAMLLVGLAGCDQPVSENPSDFPQVTETPSVTAPPHVSDTPITEITPETATPVIPDVFADDIAERILHELTRPEYNGRVTGTEEIVQAAYFLAEVFSEIGLIPYDSGPFIMEYSNSDPGIRYFGDALSDAKGYNVVGVIPGKDRTKALVVSAHYDAVSIGGGLGALDNASGVAATLRVAERLLRRGEQPETDIIFCAFDGEEIGLLGSQAFVLRVKGAYQEIFNINIDTIGLRDVPLLIVGNEKIQEDIAGLFTDKGIPLDYENMIGGTMIFGSDDTSFRNHDFSAVTLAKLGNEVFAIMHSENDVLAVLDITLIELIADVVTEFIIESQGKMY